MARFSVAFGMNETPLTKALQVGQFSRAETLIKEGSDQNMLDEGAYQLIPLYISLTRHSHHPLNFYIAKLLIEFGASVNLRIPEMDSDAECITPGQTALELLVDPYIGCINRTWNPHLEPIIGLDTKLITDPVILHKHILDFADILINSGANVNIQNEYGSTLLHHLIGYCCDVDFVQLLLDGNADINIQDSIGNTPLLLLFMPDWVDMGHSWVPATKLRHEQRKKCLEFLLRNLKIKIDIPNIYGYTPLFAALAMQDFESARILLEHGANPCNKARLATRINCSRHKFLSPLFMSFTFNTASKKTNLEGLKLLIDAGYFSCEDILDEIKQLSTEEFCELNSLCELGPQLINLMFGGTTTSLSQLCIRSIFYSCQNPKSKSKVISSGHSILEDDPDNLKGLLNSLDLPHFLLTKFQIELLAEKIRSYCFNFYFCKPSDLLPSSDYEDDSEDDSDFDFDEEEEVEEEEEEEEEEESN